MKRNSMFTMLVDVDGDEIAYHCPTKGRIVNIDIAGRPCLLSSAKDVNRKTPYTVEAIRLD